VEKTAPTALTSTTATTVEATVRLGAPQMLSPLSR
jgi:hypothetical protein